MADRHLTENAAEITDDSERFKRIRVEILTAIGDNFSPLTAENIDQLYRRKWQDEPLPFWDFDYDDLETLLHEIGIFTAQRINNVWHFSRAVPNPPTNAGPTDANIASGSNGSGKISDPSPASSCYYGGFGRGRPLPFHRHPTPQPPPVLPMRDLTPHSSMPTANLVRPPNNNEAATDIEDNLKLLKNMYPTEEEHALRSLLLQCGNNLPVVLDALVKAATIRNKITRSVVEESAATGDRKRKLNGHEEVDSPQKQERLNADQQVVEAGSDAPGPSGLQIGSNTSTISPSTDSLCLITDDDVQKVAGFLDEAERDVFNKLCGVFPDADPSHIVTLIVSNNAQESKNVDAIAQTLLTKGYPKLRDRLQREKRERRRNDFLDSARLDVDEFLRIFDDPEVYFCDRTRKVSDSYVRHALVFLMNTFMTMRREFLQYMLEQHDNHLLPAYREIQAIEGKNTKKPNHPLTKRRQFPIAPYLSAYEIRTEPQPWPDDLDEGFFREVQFISNEEKISTHMENKRKERESRFTEAKQSGNLVECPICLNEECLPEDMFRCSLNRHSFCRDCVRQHSDAQLGGGSHHVTCMVEGCEGDVGLEVLQTALRPETFSLLARRQQTAVIRQADIENLEQCPYCDFSMIIDNPAERLFRCRNRDCLKETCRECRKPSHIPLRCDEVEQDEETRMRTFVEERMAEALIRTCPTCRCRIVKSDGCNKLVCTSCGSAMCYICKQLLPAHDPYSHFNQHPGRMLFGMGAMQRAGLAGNGKCPLHTSDEMVHEEVARRAGEEAKKRFKEANPDAKTRKEKDVDVNRLVDSSAPNPHGPRGPPPFPRIQVFHPRQPHVPIGHGAVYLPPPNIPRQIVAQVPNPMNQFTIDLMNRAQAQPRFQIEIGRNIFMGVPDTRTFAHLLQRAAPVPLNHNPGIPRFRPANVNRLPADFEARLNAVARRLLDAVVSPVTVQLRIRTEQLRLESRISSPVDALRQLTALEAEVADIIGVAESEDLNARLRHLDARVVNFLADTADEAVRNQLTRQMQEIARLSYGVHTQLRKRRIEALVAEVEKALARRYSPPTPLAVENSMTWGYSQATATAAAAAAASASSDASSNSTEEELPERPPERTPEQQLAIIREKIKLAQIGLSCAAPFSAEARAAVTLLSDLINEQQRLNTALRTVDSTDADAGEATVSMADYEEQKRTVLALDEKVRALQKTAADCVIDSASEREIVTQLKATMGERDAAIRRRHQLRDQLLRRGANETNFGADSDSESDVATNPAPARPPRKSKPRKRDPKATLPLPHSSQTKKVMNKGEPTQTSPKTFTDGRTTPRLYLYEEDRIRFRPSLDDDELRYDLSGDDDQPAGQTELAERNTTDNGCSARAPTHPNSDYFGDNYLEAQIFKQIMAPGANAERTALRPEAQQEAVESEQARFRRCQLLTPVMRQAIALLDIFDGGKTLPENEEIVRRIEEVVLQADDRGHEFDWAQLLTIAREFVTARTPNIGIRMLELLHAFVDSLRAAVGDHTPDARRARRVEIWRALLVHHLSSMMLKETLTAGADPTVTDGAKMALMVAERERQINNEQRVLMDIGRRQRKIAERIRLQRLRHEDAERVARLQRDKERRSTLCPFCFEHDTYRPNHVDCPFRDCTCAKCNARRTANERLRLGQRLEHLRGRLAAEEGLLRELNNLGADYEQQERGAVERVGADVERLRTQIADQTREMERIRVERERNEAELTRAEAALLVHHHRLLDSQGQQRRRREVQAAEARLLEEIRVAEGRLAQLNDGQQKVAENKAGEQKVAEEKVGEQVASIALASPTAEEKFSETLRVLVAEYGTKTFDINAIESHLRQAIKTTEPEQASASTSEVQQAIVLSSDEDDDDIPAVIFQSPSNKKRDIKRERRSTSDQDTPTKNPDGDSAISSPICSQPVRFTNVQENPPRAGQGEPPTVQAANIHINIHVMPNTNQPTNDADPTLADASRGVQSERNTPSEHDLMDIE